MLRSLFIYIGKHAPLKNPANDGGALQGLLVVGRQPIDARRQHPLERLRNFHRIDLALGRSPLPLEHYCPGID